MRRYVWVIALGLGLLSAQTAHAVLGVGDAVYDFAVHFESITTAFQTTATAISAAEIVANQVLDLMSLEEWVLDNSQWMEDVGVIQKIVSEAEGLTWDINSLNTQLDQLFGLDDAPWTSSAHYEQQNEVRRMIWTGWRYAMRTQTLINTLFGTLDHVMSLYQSLKGLMGNKQALQSIAQYQAQTNQLLSAQKLQTAAFDRAKSAQSINEPLIEQTVHNINYTVLHDWALGDNGE
jgi:hypothetical protein